MLSRLARASHILSLFRYRIPTIATVLLHSRTPGSSPSLIRWHHSGRRTVSFASPSQDVADKQVNKSLRRSATHLSDEDYVDLADTYLEAVEEHAAYAKEEGLELTVEHQNDVITITAPGIGNYVLKRHDSIRQIWLSSPISGSAGFEWVEYGENGEEQDGNNNVVMGQWLQLSDGTNLSEILNRELRMEMEMNWFY